MMMVLMTTPRRKAPTKRLDPSTVAVRPGARQARNPGGKALPTNGKASVLTDLFDREL